MPDASRSDGLRAAATLAFAYIATVGGVLVAGFVYMIVASPGTCAALGRALMVLWGMLAAGALGSSLLVGVLLLRLALGTLAKVLLSLGYAVAIVVTFAFVALALTVGFNC